MLLIQYLLFRCQHRAVLWQQCPGRQWVAKSKTAFFLYVEMSNVLQKMLHQQGNLAWVRIHCLRHRSQHLLGSEAGGGGHETAHRDSGRQRFQRKSQTVCLQCLSGRHHIPSLGWIRCLRSKRSHCWRKGSWMVQSRITEIGPKVQLLNQMLEEAFPLWASLHLVSVKCPLLCSPSPLSFLSS